MKKDLFTFIKEAEEREQKAKDEKMNKINKEEFKIIDDMIKNMFCFTQPHKTPISEDTKTISKEDEKVFNEVFNAKPKTNDKTNPLHYKTTNVETIDNIYNILGEEAFYGYTIGNVIKYVSRYNSKNGVEDLEKARWYLSETIARMSGTNNEYKK